MRQPLHPRPPSAWESAASTDPDSDSDSDFARARSFLPLLLLILLLGCGSEPAPPHGVSAESAGLTVRLEVPGETLAFDAAVPLIVTAEADSAWAIALPDALDGLALMLPIDSRREEPSARQGRRGLRQVWRLEALAPGDQRIAPQPVRFRPPGESGWLTLRTPALGFHLSALLSADVPLDSLSALRAPPALARREPFPWGWGAAAVGALGLAGLLVWWWRRRKRGDAPEEVPATPLPPAGEEARAALARLRAAGLLARAELEPFFVELTRILRRYVERAFALSAPRLTSEELIAEAARDPRLDAAIRRVLAGVLAAADQVKFARHTPPVAEAEGALAEVEELVETVVTRESEEAPCDS